MDIVGIKYKKLNRYAQEPFHGSAAAAGLDLHAAIPDKVYIYPGETEKIPTGLSFELPTFMFGMIVPRSGLATKKGLRPANTPGICDSDYRGEYIVALHNDSSEIQSIEPGERIAQVLFMPYFGVKLNEVSNLSETERGEGGFGSTGTK